MTEEATVEELLRQLQQLIYENASETLRATNAINLSRIQITPEIDAILSQLAQRGVGLRTVQEHAQTALARAIQEHAERLGIDIVTLEEAAATQAAEVAAGRAALGRVVSLAARAAGVVGMALLARDAVEAQTLLEGMKQWRRDGIITQDEYDAYYAYIWSHPLASIEDKRNWINEHIIQPRITGDLADELRETYQELSRLSARRSGFVMPQFMDDEHVQDAGIIEVRAGSNRAQDIESLLAVVTTPVSVTFTYDGRPVTVSAGFPGDLQERVRRLAEGQEAVDPQEIAEAMAELETIAEALGISLPRTMVSAPQQDRGSRTVTV